MLVQRNNLFTELFSAEQSQAIWTRHESLSRIEGVLIVDQAEDDRHRVNSFYYELLGREGDHAFININATAYALPVLIFFFFLDVKSLRLKF